MSERFKFRLGSVLRARKAQEDGARGTAQRARSDADSAAAGVRRWESALGLRGVPEHGTAAAFSATMSAREALASALSASIGVARIAEQAATDRADEATEAATRRLSVEKLAERQQAAQRRARDAAEQRELDDMANTRRPGALPAETEEQASE